MQIFVDGNSRLSRLLMNWILWKKSYPLIDIPVEDLENYYDALDYYQIEKDDEPFIKYILKKYLDQGFDYYLNKSLFSADALAEQVGKVLNFQRGNLYFVVVIFFINAVKL